MILRALIAILRGACALLAGFLLLLVIAVVFDPPDPLGGFALGVVGFAVASLLWTLWAWQLALRRLTRTETEPRLHPAHWIASHHRATRSSAIAHESWGASQQRNGKSAKEIATDSLYSPEYTPGTPSEYTPTPAVHLQ